MSTDAALALNREDQFNRLITLCAQQQTTVESLVDLVTDLSIRVNVLEAHVLHED